LPSGEDQCGKVVKQNHKEGGSKVDLFVLLVNEEDNQREEKAQ
jgi:hypothetical protein